MKKVLCPVAINMYYRCGAKPEEFPELFSLNADLLALPLLISVHRDKQTGSPRMPRFRWIYHWLARIAKEKLIVQSCWIDLSKSEIVAPSESEMFEGLPETQARGIRIRHASCEFDKLEVFGLPKGESPIFYESPVD